ncbi:MAG: hypothetical protein E6R03_04010 [Hyphomicrobiaceae bacterium]|nr:MAG: hypothetical protein E6R03_04010 [Hyphomicrobiaceae bacterium]
MKDYHSDLSKYKGNDVDLRAEFSAIMRIHGHWALLRKRIKDKKCACYNTSTDEAASDCKKCLGSGYAFVDHFIRVRKQPIYQLSEVAEPVGRISPTITKFWVQYHTKPDRGDFIAEISQDETSRTQNFQIQPTVPLAIFKMYDIQDVADMREFGGRIEFFSVVVEEASFGDTT